MKLRKNKDDIGGTGGGESSHIALNAMEERIAELTQLRSYAFGFGGTKFGINKQQILDVDAEIDEIYRTDEEFGFTTLPATSELPRQPLPSTSISSPLLPTSVSPPRVPTSSANVGNKRKRPESKRSLPEKQYSLIQLQIDSQKEANAAILYSLQNIAKGIDENNQRQRQQDEDTAEYRRKKLKLLEENNDLLKPQYL